VQTVVSKRRAGRNAGFGESATDAVADGLDEYGEAALIS